MKPEVQLAAAKLTGTAVVPVALGVLRPGVGFVPIVTNTQVPVTIDCINGKWYATAKDVTIALSSARTATHRAIFINGEWRVGMSSWHPRIPTAVTFSVSVFIEDASYG